MFIWNMRVAPGVFVTLTISVLCCICWCVSLQMDRGVYKRTIAIDHRVGGGANERRLSRQTRSLHGARPRSAQESL